jgi:hypothetical protein
VVEGSKIDESLLERRALREPTKVRASPAALSILGGARQPETLAQTGLTRRNRSLQPRGVRIGGAVVNDGGENRRAPLRGLVSRAQGRPCGRL